MCGFFTSRWIVAYVSNFFYRYAHREGKKNGLSFVLFWEAGGGGKKKEWWI